MGYYIRKLRDKKSVPNWKVQFVSQKKEHIKDSSAKFPKKTWDVPRERWSALGFQPSMTIAQARNRQGQLNAQIFVTRQEERRLTIEREMERFNLETKAFLPDDFKHEFENRYFYQRRISKVLSNKELSHWRAAQRMIMEIQLDPSDWFDESHRFYDWLFVRRYSFSYCKKILSVLNLWGFFFCRKLGKPFFSIRTPRGREKARLLDSYFQKNGNCCRQSDPIAPKALENRKNILDEAQYNWLYLSVWLGLRPKEIDQLKDQRNWRKLTDSDGTPVLWVYQSKLTSVPHRYRWKLIPLFRREQLRALDIITEGAFQRPLVKTIKRHFGQNTTLYGGRKGFTDLMLSAKQDFVNISQWMGHSTIYRTWHSYKNRLVTHYDTN